MKIGRNAIFGDGNASAITGSNIQCTSRLRAIATPSRTPTTVAANNPANARNRLVRRSDGNEPSAHTVHQSATTAVKAGKNSGDASPARAAASQSTITTSTE